LPRYRNVDFSFVLALAELEANNASTPLSRLFAKNALLRDAQT